MSIYYVSQSGYCTPEELILPSDSLGAVVGDGGGTGMSNVSRFFASASTAKMDHKNDELMLHNEGPKNPENIRAYTSR
jgi:hypothetical protein